MAARKKKTTAKSAQTAAKTTKKASASKASASKASASKASAAKEPKEAKATSSKAAAPKLRAHPDAGLTKPQVKNLFNKLIEERDRINARIRQRVGQATEDATPLAEEGDIAQRATEQDYLLRLADKQHKLLDQVMNAIQKLETGEYGVCEGSEEPIGFRRLDIRPWARYSVEYKERMDRRNR